MIEVYLFLTFIVSFIFALVDIIGDLYIQGIVTVEGMCLSIAVFFNIIFGVLIFDTLLNKERYKYYSPICKYHSMTERYVFLYLFLMSLGIILNITFSLEVEYWKILFIPMPAIITLAMIFFQTDKVLLRERMNELLKKETNILNEEEEDLLLSLFNSPYLKNKEALCLLKKYAYSMKINGSFFVLNQSIYTYRNSSKIIKEIITNSTPEELFGNKKLLNNKSDFSEIYYVDFCSDYFLCNEIKEKTRKEKDFVKKRDLTYLIIKYSNYLTMKEVAMLLNGIKDFNKEEQHSINKIIND